jgi:hypothetical protein
MLADHITHRVETLLEKEVLRHLGACWLPGWEEETYGRH